MNTIDETYVSEMRGETPDQERMGEIERCFDCAAVLAPEKPHGMKVAEGIILCPQCCAHAAERDAGPQTLRLPPSWYYLTGEQHHT